jgi:hypothetical protein
MLAAWLPFNLLLPSWSQCMHTVLPVYVLFVLVSVCPPDFPAHLPPAAAVRLL